MRPQNKRGRGRNGGGGGPYQHNNQNRGPRPPQRSQTFDSNGPAVKIRGNAYQVFERYVALAREAATSGDRIAAENLYQHAEHYFRIMNANGEGPGQQGGVPRPMTPADTEMTGSDADQGEHEHGSQQGYSGGQGSGGGQQHGHGGAHQPEQNSAPRPLQTQEPAPSSQANPPMPTPQTDPLAS